MTSIAIVEPTSSGLDLIDAANSMGIEVHVLSYNSADRSLPANAKQKIKTLTQVDTNDEIIMLKACMRLYQRVKFAAIIPGFEYYVPIVSKINWLLGLNGLTTKDIGAIRYKQKMRQRLSDSQLRCPKFMVVNSKADLDHSAKHVGFPAVIKPIGSSGSLHVSKVMAPKDVVSAYTTLCEDSDKDLGHPIGTRALVEEYIEGDEISVEGYIQDDRMHIVAYTEKILGSEPYFVEMGHIIQANLPEHTKTEIKKYVEKVVKVLGISIGPFHCELRYGKKGPTLIEIGARLPGDQICKLVSLVTGFDFAKAMIECYLGIPVSSKNSNLNSFAGICFFAAPTLKYYKSVVNLHRLYEIPGFLEFKAYIAPLTPIPPLVDFRGRLGSAIFTANSYTELRTRLKAANEIVRFV